MGCQGSPKVLVCHLVYLGLRSLKFWFMLKISGLSELGEPENIKLPNVRFKEIVLEEENVYFSDALHI